MAGYVEWSKGLANKRETVIMAATLKIDRHEMAGRLMAFWEWCDDNVPEEMIDKDTGNAVIVLSPVRGDTEKFIDQVVALKGFSRALESVGWLNHKRGAIVLPHFGRHNGSTAKSRNRNTRNQAKRRANSVTNLSPPDGDKKATNGNEQYVRSVVRSEDSLEGVQGEPKAVWEFEIRCLDDVTTLDLKDDLALCNIHRDCFKQQPAAVGRDVAAVTRFFACAVHAMAHGKTNRLGLFRYLVCNPSKARFDGDDLSEAAGRLKHHRKQIAANPDEFKHEHTPLCDDDKEGPA